MAPGRVPVLGHLPALAARPMRFLERLRPAGGLARVDLGRRPMVFLTAPALVHELLTEHSDRCERGLIYDRARTVFGNGLATSDGAFHRAQRRVVQPAFGRQRVAGYTEVMRRRTSALVESWRPGQVVALDVALDRLTLDIAADALFDRELSPEAADQVRRLIPVIVHGLLWRMLVPARLDGRLPPPAVRRFDTAAARLRAVLDRAIGARRDAPGTDLLGVLLAGMSEEAARDEVVSLLMAGTETLASTLTWMFYEIAGRPEIERRLREEPGGDYARRVVDETLRLHAPLLFTRRLREPVTLAGVRLPEGTELAYSPHALHRDPSVFDRAGEFDPDRWLSAPADSLPRGAFTPFSVGVHRCIGESYARAALATITAAITARWRFHPVPGYRPRIVPAEIPRLRSLPVILRESAPSAH
ncbi:cytochrome P450 [Pseudonocardia eucalypti]|uniref:Cytochrome P450 n=1 Tax=Pseudonocardia eucalypti TaxID=648755 RepID=A0ABP9QNI7_9PSEU